MVTRLFGPRACGWTRGGSSQCNNTTGEAKHDTCMQHVCALPARIPSGSSRAGRPARCPREAFEQEPRVAQGEGRDPRQPATAGNTRGSLPPREIPEAACHRGKYQRQPATSGKYQRQPCTAGNTRGSLPPREIPEAACHQRRDQRRRANRKEPDAACQQKGTRGGVPTEGNQRRQGGAAELTGEGPRESSFLRTDQRQPGKPTMHDVGGARRTRDWEELKAIRASQMDGGKGGRGGGKRGTA
eukprot:357281-Chlamydomonas_euryale.AAC.34